MSHLHTEPSVLFDVLSWKFVNSLLGKNITSLASPYLRRVPRSKDWDAEKSRLMALLIAWVSRELLPDRPGTI